MSIGQEQANEMVVAFVRPAEFLQNFNLLAEVFGPVGVESLDSKVRVMIGEVLPVG